jgi:hypothetical protein
MVDHLQQLMHQSICRKPALPGLLEKPLNRTFGSVATGPPISGLWGGGVF